MAGPTPMALGPYAFEAVGFGFDRLGRELRTDWAEIRLAQGWDGLQWTGPTSEEVRIRGVLFPEALGGLASLEGIRAAGVSGAPQFLATLGGNIVGLMVVTGLSEDQRFHDGRGLPRQDRYQITLRRYAGSPAAALAGVIRLFG